MLDRKFFIGKNERRGEVRSFMFNYDKAYKKVHKYFSQHPDYNSTVSFIGGAGVGVLLTYPLVGLHPLRWSIVLLVVALLGHLYPLMTR